MTISEPNPAHPTGEEPGEYSDDGPLTRDDETDSDAEHADPSRRPTGAPPVSGRSDPHDA